MKATYLRQYILPMVTVGFASALACQAGPAIIISPPTVVVSPPPPPAVVISAPAPAVTVTVAPDDYYWDGYENVGIVGGQYYYLGPGGAWVVMDSGRLNRFHDWQRVHTDWRTHSVHNVNYRSFDHGPAHAAPMHDDHHYDQPAHDDHHDDHDHNNPPH